MKTYAATLAALLAIGGDIAWAAGTDCEETYRRLLRGESGEYPYTARSVTEFSGTKTNSIFAAESPGAYLTIDERTGLWILIRDGKAWQSADKGASWKHLYDLPANQAEQIKENLVKRAESATNIECEDGAAFDGGTYQRLSGEWDSSDGTKAKGRSDYYLRQDGRWHAAVTEMTMTSGTSKITQVKLPEDEWLDVPKAE